MLTSMLEYLPWVIRSTTFRAVDEWVSMVSLMGGSELDGFNNKPLQDMQCYDFNFRGKIGFQKIK